MHPRKAPCKPSRTGRFFSFLEECDLFYCHALVDCLAHIVDGQRGHANSGEGLYLDAGTVVRTGRRGDRYAILAYFELDVNGGQVQPVTERYELWRLLGRHHTGDPGRIQHVALGQSRVSQLLYSLGRHAHDSPGDGGAPHHFLLPHVDHPGRTLAVEMREFHVETSVSAFQLVSMRPASPNGLSAFQLARSQALADLLTRRRSRRADKRRRKPERAD